MNFCNVLKEYEKEKKNLFIRICSIIKEFSIKKRKKQLRGFNNFNFFKILGLTSDENRHSKIIAEFLNPKGSHFQESLFLEIFFKEVLGINFNGENIKVLVEKCVEFEGQGRIDILIETEKEFYIIENKIYATDQDKQIYRYLFALKKENPNKKINVIYLTLNKRNPSNLSLNGLTIKGDEIFDNKDIVAKYFNITYDDILKWMKLNLEEVKNISNLREAILQYILAVEELLGIKGDFMNLKDYLMRNYKNILGDILENYDEWKNSIDKECRDLIQKEGLDGVIEDIKRELRKEIAQKLCEKIEEVYGNEFIIEGKNDFLIGEKWSPLLLYKNEWKYKNDNKGILSIAIEFGQYNYKMMYYGIAKYSEDIPYQGKIPSDNILKKIQQNNSKFNNSNWYLIWEYIPKECGGRLDKNIYYKEMVENIEEFVEKYYFKDIRNFIEKNKKDIDDFVKKYKLIKVK